MNPAFCKLEVQNREGESKYLQRAIYAGDHHQLGIILVPDPDGGITAETKPSSIFSIIGMRTGIRQRGVQGDRLGRAKKTPPAEAKQTSPAEAKQESAGV